MILTDYHSHTPRCGHAQGAMEEYVERALALGLSEFGFSDHSPWMIQHPGMWVAMKWAELPQYVRDVQALQARYGRAGDQPFRVRLGLEVDFVPGRLEIAREALAPHPWDYLIGSVHHLGLWGLPNPPEAAQFDDYRIEDVCEGYFMLVRQMIEARLIDIIAHLDLPKKFSRRPDGGMLRWVEPLIPLMKTNEITVEINTSGLDHPCGEIYPAWGLIEALAAGGVGLTLCSDAHKPQDVGRYFPQAIERLHAIGVSHLVRYDRRVPSLYPLPAVQALGSFSPVSGA
jgi:histidinol-phosphatase (PHP family)